MEKSEKAQLGLILIVAFFFRLLSAWRKDFWLDEAISWSFAKQSLGQMLKATAADNHPPLYYLLLHLWQKLGQTELFLRLPSIIFGVISIFLVYQIARKLFNQKVALTASFIFALSPPHVSFSADTRMYSLFTLLTLTGFYFFIKILKKPTKNDYTLFAICYLLSLYTHYFTIFFILALDLFLIFKMAKYKKQLINLLLSQIGAGLLFLPWLVFIFTNPHPKPWAISPLIGIPATLMSFVLGGVGPATLKTFFTATVPFFIKTVFVLTPLFFTYFFFLSLIGKEKRGEKSLLTAVIFIPVLVVTLISLFYPIYSPRPFLISAPYFYILASWGMEKWGRKWTKTIAIIFLVFILLAQNFYPPFKPQTLKQAVDFIKTRSPTPLIVHTDILTFYPFSYYFGEKAVQFHVFPSELTKQTTDIIGGSPVSLTEVTGKNQPFWSVHFTWDEKTWEFEEEQPQLKKDFKYNKVMKINDLEIFYYQPY